MDIAEKKRAQLKQLFPEVFAEEAVDFDQLKRVLGEWVEPAKERFGLNWPGKAECMRIIQQPSVAALEPVRGESVRFDDTENLFIEGDNLEVLKLLQKSYFGKVKMIYIDPPYNTGKEFIYPDKYSETLDTYLEYTGQKDNEGRKFSTNTDTVGRYHSNWLNMMYPRLYLARSLLREDGVIFISIGDNEVANLKGLSDQIFGEENFVGSITREAKKGANRGTHLAPAIDYILIYAREIDNLSEFHLPMDQEYIDSFQYNDNDGKGYYKLTNLYEPSLDYYPNCRYPIQCPDGVVVITPENKSFSHNKESFNKMLKNGSIKLVKARSSQLVTIAGDPTNWSAKRKIYLEAMKDKGRRPSNLLLDIINAGGAKTTNSLDIPYDYPKPVELVKFLLKIIKEPDCVVLDFFAGSATTAHAVMQLNVEDAGNRKYICIQLPEPCDKKSDAYKAGLKTISDIAKERIRRAAKRIEKEQGCQLNLNDNKEPDLGFKVFKLSRSNFKVWEGEVEKNKNIEQKLLNHIHHIDDTSTPEDILYELLLKRGFSLTTHIKKRILAGKEVFSIEKGELLICLEHDLTQEVIDAIADANPLQVICLDDGFRDNDQLKANAVQTFKTRAQQKEQETVFHTV